jgi:hypothetical protein
MAGYVRRRETPALTGHPESLTPAWSKKQAFSLGKENRWFPLPKREGVNPLSLYLHTI